MPRISIRATIRTKIKPKIPTESLLNQSIVILLIFFIRKIKNKIYLDSEIKQ